MTNKKTVDEITDETVNETVDETTTPPSLATLLEEKSIDLSQPKELSKFLQTLDLNELLAFFPLVSKRLYIIGMVRQISATNAKGHTVGTTEYAASIRKGFGVWERGYLTVAEETRALKPTTKKGGGFTLPHPRESILREWAEILPTGNSEKAKRARGLLENASTYSLSDFTNYIELAMKKHPEAIMSVAVNNLTKVGLEKLEREEQERAAKFEF